MDAPGVCVCGGGGERTQAKSRLSLIDRCIKLEAIKKQWCV